MSTLLPCYVLLDLETTGATPTQDRITEIGLIRYENGIEVGRWNTLINPEVSISPFISAIDRYNSEHGKKCADFL